MNIGDILTRDCLLLSVRAADYSSALLQVATHLSYLTELRPQQLHEALMERESRCSTGLGRGVALPHARVAGLKQVYGVFVRFSPALDVAAADNMNVDVAFVLVAPESANASYLRLVGKIAAIFKSEESMMQLRNSDDKELLHSILISQDA